MTEQELAQARKESANQVLDSTLAEKPSATLRQYRTYLLLWKFVAPNTGYSGVIVKAPVKRKRITAEASSSHPLSEQVQQQQQQQEQGPNVRLNQTNRSAPAAWKAVEPPAGVDLNVFNIDRALDINVVEQVQSMTAAYAQDECVDAGAAQIQRECCEGDLDDDEEGSDVDDHLSEDVDMEIDDRVLS
ncbi:hypothetical protein EDD11_008710 [Mortierella claussenii]|nr:hypothetical protein EDD11_008710 [Mortierella claussenii]